MGKVCTKVIIWTVLSFFIVIANNSIWPLDVSAKIFQEKFDQSSVLSGQSLLDFVFDEVWESIDSGKKFSVILDDLESFLQDEGSDLGVIDLQRHDNTLIWDEDVYSTPVAVDLSLFFSIASVDQGDFRSGYPLPFSVRRRSLQEKHNGYPVFVEENIDRTLLTAKTRLKYESQSRALILSEFRLSGSQPEATANPARAVFQILQEQGIEVDVKGPTLALEDFADLSGYDMVLMVGHGAPGQFATGIPFAEVNESQWEIDGKSTLMRSNNNIVAITPRFIENFSQIKEGALIYLNSCDSLSPDINGMSVAQSFRKKGAEVVLGYDGIVPMGAGKNATIQVFESLASGESVSLAMDAALDRLNPESWERRIINIIRSLGADAMTGGLSAIGDVSRPLLTQNSVALAENQVMSFQRVPSPSNFPVMNCMLCTHGSTAQIQGQRALRLSLMFQNSTFSVKDIGDVILENGQTSASFFSERKYGFGLIPTGGRSGNTITNPMVTDVNADNIEDVIGIMFMSYGGSGYGHYYLFSMISQRPDSDRSINARLEDVNYSRFGTLIDDEISGILDLRVRPNYVIIVPRVYRQGDHFRNPSGRGEPLIYRLFQAGE